MSPRSFLAVLSALMLLALSGCVAQDPAPSTPTSLDELGLRIDRLRRGMADVAEAQDAATGALRPMLEAVREMDAFVAGMRDPERIRSVEETWPRVTSSFTSADPEGLREPLVDVALKVDRARASLARARELVLEDWERAYLDAEDDLLMAVRAHAADADALAQILQRHWPTYTAVHAGSEAFVEANEFYRSGEEAVQAYEVRVGRSLGRLATAQQEIARFREAQRDAAERVNRAARAAEEAWASRPAPAPSPAP